MCGIVGVAGRISAEEGLCLVERMNQAIVHRGPDDNGVWAAERIAFGMQRLSIIDLAGGHQPIWIDDRVGIVFNGEIYNFQRLRENLIESGYIFATRSDTEVILKLYHRDGLAAIDQLEGMFAIAIVDRRSGQLHLIRDRLGVKPLYYARVDGRFYFASEIKALVRGAGLQFALDRQALHDYLTLRFVPSCETVWDGMAKLSPGHRLTLDLETLDQSVERYWALDFVSLEVEPARDYEGEFERLFLAAVEKRLVASDVPVGVLLSGGLDSSAVSAAAVELGHRNFHTFSVAFDDGGVYDETPYARAVAAHLGSEHHEVFIGQREFIDFLPELVRITDEPLADLACVPLHFVCKLAREHVKVVMSGEGADEIFAGYDFEHLSRQLQRIYAARAFIPTSILRMASGLLRQHAWGRLLQLLAEVDKAGFLQSKAQHITRHFDEVEKAGLWLSGDRFRVTDEEIRRWYGEARSAEPLDQIQQVYSREWLVEDLLMKADKISMANSLELREPFLDHTLVEWAEVLPVCWKVGSGKDITSKRILRRFAARRLPHQIIERPKRGFPAPAYVWLQGELAGWAESVLLGPASKLRNHFDVAQAGQYLAKARLGDMAAAHKVWVLVILEYWLQEWT
ncbi:MAG: hypothetical protein H6R13_3297 [Proteobacteria bacterium]|nr:hypothetical protein [Pseudomonadota bacterium]